jgi:POT family proton-dependent oligopeptide transporter
MRILWIGIKNGGNLDAARPSSFGKVEVEWDDKFVDELRRALMACRVL